MHAERQRPIDVTFRVECDHCSGSRFAELGGIKRLLAEAGEFVVLRCGLCSRYRRFEVVAP